MMVSMAADRKTGVGTAGGQKPGRTAPPRSPSVAIEPKRPPQRPKRRGSVERKPASRLVRTLSSLLTAVMLVVAIGAGGTYLINAQFEAPGPLEAAKGFIVPKGAGRLDIAEKLEREGVITSHWVFTTGGMLQAALGIRKTGELKFGSYEFKKNATMREVADVLAEGKSVAAKITIPEGLTSQQIVERLKAAEALTGDIAAIPAEGTLMPDTYAFTRGTARQDMLDRMTAEQTKFVATAWEKRSASIPFATPQQALIMASIIEKETGRGDERDKVAAVFVNRLRKNMRLQSDPTIIYGISGGQGPLGRAILRSDIDQKTAYNTYQIDGLPPTPIANPGRAAIEATLNPAQTNDIYFVADGTGGHTFTTNLKDHNAAVANWRRVEKETKAAKAAAAAQAAAAPAAVPAAAAQATKLNGPGAVAAPAPAAAADDATPVMGSDPDAASADPAAPAPAQTAAVAPVNTANVPLPTRKPKR